MRLKKRIFRLGVVIAVLTLVILGALKLRQVRRDQLDGLPTPRLPPWAVRVARVKIQALADGFQVLATVLTRAELTLSGQLQGEILEMGPREGGSVKKGDLLARIDTREIDQQILSQEAKLAAAASDLANKEQELKREKELLAVGGSSASKVESWQTAVRTVRQSVESLQRLIDSLKVRRGYALVTAPVDGVIAARLAEPGDICQMAHPLYRMTVDQGARVQVRLPQGVLERIHPGGKVILSHGGKNQTVTISRVFPALDELALGRAEADLDAPPFGLPSGSRVSARVITRARDHALVVPQEGVMILEDPTRGKAFKVISGKQGDHVEIVALGIDLVAPDGVAVTGPLSAGDRVVVAHETVLLQLHTGDPVRVIEDAP